MWCFYYLLKITTIAIIKANAIIVIPTKPYKRKRKIKGLIVEIEFIYSFKNLYVLLVGKIMTCKGAGGKKAKYMYYFCDNCNLYYNEAEIEDCLIDYIWDLVEYDFHVNKYFYPLLAEKKNNETKDIEKEIKKLKEQKESLMKVYVNGILHEEDFAKDYEFIEKKLAELENKKIDSLNFDKETYNPQHLLAERDIENVINLIKD